MERIDLVLKTCAAGAAAIWGGLIPLVQLLILLMVIDIVSGMLVAIQGKTLSSSTAFKGMTKKAMALLLIGAAGAIEVYAVTLVGEVPIQATVAGFYCGSELLSVVENAALAGLPVPKVLRDVLAKISPEQSGAV